VISGNRVWHHQQQWKLLADNCSADIENASSERKIWLATTGREFEEEVIEQLAVTPKFVVRGEVLPSYGQILPATSEVGTAGVVSCAPASALL
jgi:hypothetical protein